MPNIKRVEGDNVSIALRPHNCWRPDRRPLLISTRLVRRLMPAPSQGNLENSEYLGMYPAHCIAQDRCPSGRPDRGPASVAITHWLMDSFFSPCCKAPSVP